MLHKATVIEQRREVIIREGLFFAVFEMIRMIVPFGMIAEG